MPRILRIINRLNLGGPTFNAAYLTKHLLPEFETMLVAGMIDPSEASSEFILKEMGLQPLYIPQMYREIDFMKDRQAYFEIKKLIDTFRPDIVHTHAAKAGALGRWAAAACNVPVIIHTFHGHVFHSYFPKWKTDLFIRAERNLAAKSTRIIAISESQKRELNEVYHIADTSKIEVIPLGFDLERFATGLKEKRISFRNYYLVDDDELVIAIVGRLVPVKNHRMFLRVFKDVQQKTRKRIRAFIVGDGEERHRLETLCNQLQLDFTDFRTRPRKASVTFTSWIHNVDEVYAGADIVALTSLNEGTPVSIIEAQVAGKPVVATNAGGIADIVLPGKSALIVESNDIEAFSANLLRLIEDDAFRKSFSGQYANEILQRFSYKRMTEETGKLYNQLLGGKR